MLLETAKKVNALGPGYKVRFKPVELHSRRMFIMDFWKMPTLLGSHSVFWLSFQPNVRFGDQEMEEGKKNA